MKKIYVFLLFVFLFGFVGLDKAKATCPDGWFEHWEMITYTYEYNGAVFYCNVWVNFCCRWNPETHRVEIILKNLGATEPDYADCLSVIYYTGWLWESYVHSIYQKVIELAKSDPNCFLVCPPCDGGVPALTYVLKVYQCYKWVSRPVLYTWNGRPLEWIDEIQACDLESYCLYTYACCSDWNTSPPETHAWLISVQEFGTPQCTTTKPQVPPPGKDWNETWETECFAEPCQSQ